MADRIEAVTGGELEGAIARYGVWGKVLICAVVCGVIVFPRVLKTKAAIAQAKAQAQQQAQAQAGMGQRVPPQPAARPSANGSQREDGAPAGWDSLLQQAQDYRPQNGFA
jgi:hypothetical protein